VPAKQVCSPVGDRCDQIMNEGSKPIKNKRRLITARSCYA